VNAFFQFEGVGGDADQVRLVDERRSAKARLQRAGLRINDPAEALDR
jgi:hypothetical protein